MTHSEADTIKVMIEMYCRHHHKKSELCDECAALYEYAEQRIIKCPFGAEKPNCNQCTVHCYKPEMREQVKNVMRWSGPRMMFNHPVMAMQHIMRSKKPMPDIKKKSD